MTRTRSLDAAMSVVALAAALAAFPPALSADTALTPLPLPDGACGMRPVARGAFAGDAEPVSNAISEPRFDDSCRFGTGRAYRWNGTGWDDIGPPGGSNVANGTHPTGRVAGQAVDPESGRLAFTWSVDAGALVLPRSADAINATADAINADGAAVGSELLASSRLSTATAWPAGGGPVRLFETFDPAPYAVRLSRALAIDDAGAIGGEWRRYTPAPDDIYAEADSTARVFRVDAAGGPVEDVFGIPEREPVFVVYSVGGPWRVIFADAAYDYRAWAGDPDDGDIERVVIDGAPYDVLLRDANRAGQSVHEKGGQAWLRDVDGGLIALRAAADGVGSGVSDLADSGRSAGRTVRADGSSRATIWTADGTATDLNELLPSDAPAGLVLGSAASVSESGAVVAQDTAGGWWLLAGGGEGPGDADADADGVDDAADNCPSVANADQADLDSDGAGDACDADVDGDGVANASDACPGTELDARPTDGARRNRYYANGEGVFVDGVGAASGYTVADTGGCSGRQIVAAAGLGAGHLRFGVTRSALEDWIDAP